MLVYTLRIVPGGDEPYRQEIVADSLGEAIDKAKAAVRLRTPRENETEAC